MRVSWKSLSFVSGGRRDFYYKLQRWTFQSSCSIIGQQRQLDSYMNSLPVFQHYGLGIASCKSFFGHYRRTFASCFIPQHIRPQPTKDLLHFSTASPRHFTNQAGNAEDITKSDRKHSIPDRIKSLMRNSAQPVAVITAFLPNEAKGQNQLEVQDRTTPEGTSSMEESKDLSTKSAQSKIRHTGASAKGQQMLVHGATLSSFTTISMEPPLVAFSLRTPSRLADALVAGAPPLSKNASSAQKSYCVPAHFVINVLSSTQAATAAAFAQPGLSPHVINTSRSDDGEAHNFVKGRAQGEEGLKNPPAVSNSSTSSGSSAPLSQHPLTMTPTRASVYTHEGVPMLSDSLGALSCYIVARIPLQSDTLVQGHGEDITAQISIAKDDSVIGSSDLFIARVHGVEDMEHDLPLQANDNAASSLSNPYDSSSPKQRLPLIYWRQRFATVRD